MSAVLIFAFGVFVGYVFGRLPRVLILSRFKASDQALLVAFLAANGASSVLTIQMGMKDYTRGERNWERKPECAIFRILKRLEFDGTVVRENDYGTYKYRLVAPVSKLVPVD